MKKRRDRQRFAASGAAAERGPSQRQLRLGEELRHALSRILRGGHWRDPALDAASITVTEVSMSPDLRNATAFVMPLAGANAAEVLAGLGRSAGFLKGLVAREVGLRSTPNLLFALDHSFDHAERISALLAQPEVARDLQPQGDGSEDHRDES